MNDKTHATGTPPPMPNPLGLSRSTLLLRRLRVVLEEALGPTTIIDLAKLAGVPKSTFANWLNGTGQPSTEAILRMLEILPRPARNEILNTAPLLRVYPSLCHPKLAHDSVAVSHLNSILEQKNGLVLIHGSTDQDVPFVATALCHSVKMMPGARLAGVDVHKPDWFVPVPGIKYLNNVLNPNQLRTQFESLWLEVTRLRPSLVLLNGLWPAVRGLRDSVLSVLDESEIILTARSRDAVSGLDLPARIIRVESPAERPDRLRLEFECTVH